MQSAHALKISNTTVIGLFLIFFAAAGLIQLLPYGGDRSNPPVAAEPRWDNPKTRELFFRACADCHSNQTVWPWYSRIAPVSWLVAKDVKAGRRKFNVSEWNRPRNDGDEAAENFRTGDMPLESYRAIHPAARLSAAEQQEFLTGLESTFGKKKKTEDND